MDIRQMQETDISQVIELGSGVSELSTGTSSPQFYSKETLTRWVTSPNDVLLVAEEEGRVVAFSLTSYNPFSRDAYMHASAVYPEYRRRGIRSQMLERTLAMLEERGCNNVFCLVKPDNVPMQELLRRHGFEVGEKFLYIQRSLPR